VYARNVSGNYMKILASVFFLIFCANCIAQNLSEYFPVSKTNKALYVSLNGDTSMISMNETRFIFGKEYFVEIDCVILNEYCVEFTEMFYRIENDTIFVKSNKNDTMDYMFLPTVLKAHQKWICFSDWTGIEVISFKASLIINKNKYSNLLRLRIKDLSGDDRSKYDYYYKRNEGLIAETKNGKIIRYKVNF
jgi:hypothetical protein